MIHVIVLGLTILFLVVIFILGTWKEQSRIQQFKNQGAQFGGEREDKIYSDEDVSDEEKEDILNSIFEYFVDDCSDHHHPSPVTTTQHQPPPPLPPSSIIPLEDEETE